jgi:hypothetical protein
VDQHARKDYSAQGYVAETERAGDFAGTVAAGEFPSEGDYFIGRKGRKEGDEENVTRRDQQHL